MTTLAGSLRERRKFADQNHCTRCLNNLISHCKCENWDELCRQHIDTHVWLMMHRDSILQLLSGGIQLPLVQ